MPKAEVAGPEVPKTDPPGFEKGEALATGAAMAGVEAPSAIVKPG